MLRQLAGRPGCVRASGVTLAPRRGPVAAAARPRTFSASVRKKSPQYEQKLMFVRGPARRSQQQQQQQQQQQFCGLKGVRSFKGLDRSASRGAAGVCEGISVASRSYRTAAAASRAAELEARNRKVAIYMASVVTAVLGVSYAAVPLYKVFCQVTGFGGTTQIADAEKALKMKPVEGGRVIRVTFDGGTADTMPWKFRPTQGDIKVVPGETALAFFTAKNPTKKHITGVATYNVFPLKAGIYFNKIQCFCFEEQRLRAGEEIDMPVFFFLDPEMLDDPTMDSVNNITLSYTFFKTAEEDAVEEKEEEEEDEADNGSDTGGRVVLASAQ